MREHQNLLRIITLLLVILVVGIVGYMTIENWSFIDSLYMTIITISTVGYREVHPLSDAGKIFSACLIVSGVGVGLYAFTNLIDYFVRGYILNIFGRHRMENDVQKMQNHFILCGYDRIGKVVSDALRAEGTPFVILTADSAEEAGALDKGCLCLKGDPSDDDILRKAGIERARGLIAVTESDATNVFIIVSARNLRNDLFIVARASTQDSVSKLEAAGANRAISPYFSGGERIARIALYPGVTDFIESVLPGYGGEMGLEEIEIYPDSQLIGKSIKQVQDYSHGASILAIRKKGNRTIAKPSDENRIDPGDRLIVLGHRDQLRLLESTTRD